MLQGDALISWSDDKTLRSWDINSGKNKQVFEGHTSVVYGALIQGDMLLSWSENELLTWDLSKAKIIQRLEIKVKGIRIEKGFLFLRDALNTLWIYRFPTLEYICRFTTDAHITTFQVAEDRNRIILGDASGRIHFLEPVGFEV